MSNFEEYQGIKITFNSTDDIFNSDEINSEKYSKAKLLLSIWQFKTTPEVIKAVIERETTEPVEEFIKEFIINYVPLKKLDSIKILMEYLLGGDATVNDYIKDASELVNDILKISVEEDRSIFTYLVEIGLDMKNIKVDLVNIMGTSVSTVSYLVEQGVKINATKNQEDLIRYLYMTRII